MNAVEAAGAPVTLHVGDAAAARLAAARARAVPGVVALQADLAQALLGVAGAVFGAGRTSTIPDDGVGVAVRGGTAEVTISVVTRLGVNCRDLAVAVQRAVTDELAAQAGLHALVRVTIADVLPG